MHYHIALHSIHFHHILTTATYKKPQGTVLLPLTVASPASVTGITWKIGQPLNAPSKSTLTEVSHTGAVQDCNHQKLLL